MRLGSFITKLKDILTSFAIPKVACRLPVSLAIAATFVISSCEVHEWPTPAADRHHSELRLRHGYTSVYGS